MYLIVLELLPCITFKRILLGIHQRMNARLQTNSNILEMADAAALQFVFDAIFINLIQEKITRRLYWYNQC